MTDQNKELTKSQKIVKDYAKRYWDTDIEGYVLHKLTSLYLQGKQDGIVLAQDIYNNKGGEVI